MSRVIKAQGCRLILPYSIKEMLCCCGLCGSLCHFTCQIFGSNLSSSSHADLPQFPNTALFLGRFFAPLLISRKPQLRFLPSFLLPQYKMLHSSRDQQKLPFLLPPHLERKSAFWGLELSAQYFSILYSMRFIIFI